MSEQLSNPEMDRQADIYDLQKQLERWEQATAQAEQGHATRLDLIGDKETLSRISQEIAQGDTTELVTAAQSALDEMYEDSKQKVIEGRGNDLRNLKKSDEEVVASDPACNLALHMKDSLDKGSLENLKNPNIFDLAIKRILSETQKREGKGQWIEDKNEIFQKGSLVAVKRSSGEWESDWKIGEVDQQKQVIRVIKQLPENGQIIYKDVPMDLLAEWQKENQIGNKETVVENQPEKEWTENRLREAVINVEVLLSKQEEALRNNDINTYDEIVERRSQMMDEIYKSIPDKMQDFFSRLVEEQSHRTLQRRIVIGNRAEELRKQKY